MKRAIIGTMALIAGLLLTGCGGGTGEADNSIILPSITNLKIEIISEDDINNIGVIHTTSIVENATSITIYSNNTPLSFDSGTIEDGYITINSGRHTIKVCAENVGGTICSDEITILISENLSLDSYIKIPIEEVSGGLTNNGNQLVYGTMSGEIYSLNIDTGISTFMYNANRKISGLSYLNNGSYYYSSITSGGVYELNIQDQTENTLAYLNFPDGLDLYSNEIYVVENDQSGTLSVLDQNGNINRHLDTGISDITGIAHTSKYLYVLSEDGEIFQVDSVTGLSKKIFTNDNFFTAGNSNNGLEGITILNNKIYVSYIDDTSIYLINIDLSKYE